MTTTHRPAPRAPLPGRPARPFVWERWYPEGVGWEGLRAPSTLTAMFRDAVETHGDLPAIDYRGGRLSYRELGAWAARAAEGFRRLGLGPGSCVGLYMPNCMHHPVLFFGALLAGCRVAQISPLDAARVISHKLTDAGVDALCVLDLPPLVEKAAARVEAGDAPRLVHCDDAFFAEGPGPQAPPPPGATTFAALVEGTAGDLSALTDDWVPEDVALLQYTGGTTGLPKGAMLTHANLTAACAIYESWTAAWGEPEDGGQEVVICVLPLFHIYSLTVILLRQLQAGARILMHQRFDARAALDTIETERVTYFPGVPTMWIAMTDQPDIDRRDLSSLRVVGSGGAPLPVETARRFHGLTGLTLTGGWGMTETSPAGTNIPFGAPPEKAGTIGIPMPGLEMAVVILEDHETFVEPDVIGEIVIRGPNITPGYWQREDANETAFKGGWFHTGDVGRMDPEGWFFLVDRRTDLILSGGFNVYPQMVEQAVYEHPAVTECLVIGVPDAYRGQSAKAYVALRPGAAAPSLEELQAFLKDRLGPHEMPRALEVREALPRTAVGKLSRQMLRDEVAAADAA